MCLSLSYKGLVSAQNIDCTYKILCGGGNQIKTKKRNLTMYQYGGTIGPARYPTYTVKREVVSNHGQNTTVIEKHMLPRPVVKSRPNMIGHMYMNHFPWLIDLCRDIEQLTLQYVQNNKSQSTEIIEQYIAFSKKHIPPCLRICNTFFTQMILVGCMDDQEGNIPPHHDEDDHITALYSLSNSDSLLGGNTYYAESNQEGVLNHVQEVIFKHGNIQIGFYDKVVHGAYNWTNGSRCVINFSLQKKNLSHFYTHGNKFYQQYIDAGYPSGEFNLDV